MTHPGKKGQALVETALVIPVLLLILWGTYASTYAAIIKSRAESAVFTEVLRAGRGLPGIEKDLSRSILPNPGSASVRANREKKSSLLPLPFPSLEGRTKASAETRKEWNEIGNDKWLPAVNIERHIKLSVDCWGEKTESGKRIRRMVQGFVVLGAIR